MSLGFYGDILEGNPGSEEAHTVVSRGHSALGVST